LTKQYTKSCIRLFVWCQLLVTIIPDQILKQIQKYILKTYWYKIFATIRNTSYQLNINFNKKQILHISTTKSYEIVEITPKFGRSRTSTKLYELIYTKIDKINKTNNYQKVQNRYLWKIKFNHKIKNHENYFLYNYLLSPIARCVELELRNYWYAFFSIVVLWPIF